MCRRSVFEVSGTIIGLVLVNIIGPIYFTANNWAGLFNLIGLMIRVAA